MHVGRNRIFVGNLPPSINENDIKEQFGKYGNVVSVEIKHRKENINENVSPVFAFVSIETDRNQLHECFQSIANYNWNGYYVKLELAKESFLERLKREREEAQNKKSSDAPINIENNLTPSKLITPSSSKKKVYSSSSESSSSSSSSEDDEVKLPKSKTQNGFTPKDETPLKINTDDPDLVIKNNKNKHLTNGRITIESVNSTPIHIISRKQNSLQKNDEKLTPADEKRLNSLYKLKESYDQQKNLIKNALSHIDTKTSNKIIFDDEGRQTNKRKKRYDQYNDYDYNQYNDYDRNKSKKERFSLFADDDEEGDINFEIKNQFEGRQGQRLLELQSRYTNDKRFTLDSRFVDEDNDEQANEQFEENEKQKQIEILESVIGKKITKIPHQDLNKKNIPRGMLRYDPTNIEHSKFEIKEKPSNNNDVLQKQIVEDKIADVPIEISKEKFYKVTDNLKQAFKESQGFSLLNMFGRMEDEDKKEPENQESTAINQLKFDTNRNPFRYDSSDSEDENVKDKPNYFGNEKIKTHFSRPISGEKFFFQIEDERLKDGLDFLKNVGVNKEGNAEKFTETRHEIKQIIRSKVRHVQRDNRPFRQKIGQHKHIKIKKAKRN